MAQEKITLEAIARQAMLDKGFLPDIPKKAMDEAAALSLPSAISSNSIRDMRDKLWVSIDNDDSEDLDQLTYAESSSDMNTIYVAIADVTGLVKPSTAIDNYAAHNTTSVYTPTIIFPMLPLKLSTDLTSLNEKKERTAIIVEMSINNKGKCEQTDVYQALVYNHAKLTYNGVGAFLENQTRLPAAYQSIPGLYDQLTLQDRIAQKLRKNRFSEGALTFGTIELRPVISDGQVISLQEAIFNRANRLIENYMISANVAMTKYMESNQLPVLKRIVRTPKRWDRIIELASQKGYKLPSQPDVKALQDFLNKQKRANPAEFPDLSLSLIKLIGNGEYVIGLPGQQTPGHFDLALRDYAHTTAPNRRYPDLIMQRLLKSLFTKQAIPYNNDELDAIALQCTQKEDDATKVERRVNKSAAAMVLQNQVGRQFPAIVTGAAEKGTWVRLMDPPLEGKLVKGFEGVDVGDHVQVKLIHVDIWNGFIDFAKVT